MEKLSYLVFSITAFMISWLFFDSLHHRRELSSSMKMVGFFLLGLAAISRFQTIVSEEFFFQIFSVIAFYILFIGFTVSEFKLTLTILIILATSFLHGHILLAAQAIILYTVILHQAYSLKHRDFISLGVGFVLVSIGEFLKSLGNTFMPAASVLYLFAACFFIIWLWQYLGPRLRFRKIIHLNELPHDSPHRQDTHQS